MTPRERENALEAARAVYRLAGYRAQVANDPAAFDRALRAFQAEARRISSTLQA